MGAVAVAEAMGIGASEAWLTSLSMWARGFSLGAKGSADASARSASLYCSGVGGGDAMSLPAKGGDVSRFFPWMVMGSFSSESVFNL